MPPLPMPDRCARAPDVPYPAHLGETVDADHPAVLVSLCDQLHNARVIAADASGPAGPGAGVWDRFAGAAADTACYFRSLTDALCRGRRPSLELAEFDAAVEQLSSLAEVAASAGDGGSRRPRLPHA